MGVGVGGQDNLSDHMLDTFVLNSSWLESSLKPLRSSFLDVSHNSLKRIRQSLRVTTSPLEKIREMPEHHKYKHNECTDTHKPNHPLIVQTYSAYDPSSCCVISSTRANTDVSMCKIVPGGLKREYEYVYSR